MPRIDAPTVAEHHARRRAALLDAGATLLADKGVDGITLAAVGAAAGLARSSVYQYFDSAPALIAAIVEDAFPRASDRLRVSVEAAATPSEQVDAYVSTALDLAADPGHRSLYALAGMDLPAGCRARVAELHQEQFEPLRRALEGLGVSDPQLATRLVVGLIGAGARAIIDGASTVAVQESTLALLHHGLLRA